MWILENEVLFDGKRVWLKPGSQHLIGRTNPPEPNTSGMTGIIKDKTVSKQHIQIKVAQVPAGEGTQLHTRSRVEITSLSEKVGASIDGGLRMKQNETAVLSGAEHTIRLGSWPKLLRIYWQPVVLTYASKESKQAKDRSARLHSLDIKTTTEFIYEKTTHVVALKRNLPKVLQGLICARPIVTPTFLDAVLQVATAPASTNEYIACPLEIDFDHYWPNVMEHIPPIGQEPVPRADAFLKPDPARAEVFAGLTFIFLDEKQYSSLSETVSTGAGKALLYPLRVGETTVEEFVDYVRSSVGGKKGRGERNESPPVVTIRILMYPDGMEEWASRFVEGIDTALKQRSIQQNELLDAIIMNDTTSLRRRPHRETQIPSSPRATPRVARASSSLPEPTPISQPPSQSLQPTTEVVEETMPSTSVTRKRPYRRGITVSRFTGFDDDDSPPPSANVDEDANMLDEPQSLPVTESHLTPVPESASPHLDVPSQSLQAREAGRKRKSPFPEGRGASETIDELFPAAAAMKKRRLETQASRMIVTEVGSVAEKPRSKAEEALEKLQKAKKKVVGRDIDVREQTRLRIKAEEEARRQDEESLRQALEGIDISEIRGLVQVEEMNIVSKASKLTARDEGWDDAWNERNNFKKFRRKGAERGPQVQKILVPLEEAPQRKSFVINEPYFLEEASSSKSKEPGSKSKGKARQGADPNSSEPEVGFRRRSRKDAGKNATVVIDSSDGPDEEEVFPEEIAGTPRNRRLAERVEETQLRETQRTQTHAGSRGKRAAPYSARNPPPSKKSRVSAPVDVDSDEEETGFRFRRRR